MRNRFVLFCLIGVLAVVLGFFTFSPSEAVVIVRKAGYWVMLGEFALFLAFLWRSLRMVPWRVELTRDGRWWLLVLIAAGFLHVHEPHGIKIMADEAVLNCTAMQMHYERDAAMVLRGHDIAGNFTPSVVLLDKRPLFFPFLVSLAHDLSGYRLENALVVNAILSVALMGLLFLVGRRLAGNWGGGVAVLMLCSVPLVAQNATAAGFEQLNLVMILCAIWLGMRAVEQPADENRLSAFVLAGVLLVQTRYESAIFILPVSAVVLYVWWRARRVLLPAVVLVSPLLLVLFPLQLNVFKLAESSWQLSGIPGATAPFAAEYFYDNVGHAVAFFLSFDGTQPSSWLVGVLGVLGVGFYVLYLYKEHRRIFRERPVEAAWVIFFAGLVVHTILMLFYFWGKWDDPIIRRLSLPFHILLVLSFLAAYPHVVTFSQRWHAMATLMVVYIFAFTIPSMAMHRYTKENMAGRVATWIHDFASDRSDRKILALDVNNGFVWILNRHASITASALAHRVDQFLFHHRLGTFDDIYIVQRIRSDLKSSVRWVQVEDDIGSAIQTEFVAERQFGTGYWVRISRVKEVDEAELRAWADAKMTVLSLPETERPGTIVQREEDVFSKWVEMLP